MSELPHPIVETISLEELKHGLADGAVALVDVREAYEWDAGHIPGATLNVLSAFDVSALPAAKAGQTIVLHCRSGKRSITALALAQHGGRKDITTHFAGGMLQWQAAGEDVD